MNPLRRLARWFRSTPLDPVRVPARVITAASAELQERIEAARAKLPRVNNVRPIIRRAMLQEHPDTFNVPQAIEEGSLPIG
jgi:hypothetical protein